MRSDSVDAEDVEKRVSDGEVSMLTDKELADMKSPEIEIGEVKHGIARYREPPSNTIVLGKVSERRILWTLNHEYMHWLFLKMFGEEGYRINDMFDSGAIDGKYVRAIVESRKGLI